MTDRSDIAGLTLHDLAVSDASRGFLLSTEIGWNQTEADWTYMLENGPGIGMTDPAGKLVASALALPYGGFGWVCMVLVAPDWRRRGIATDLMKQVTDLLLRDGTVPGLDATPDGREVYRQIGFRDIYGLERLVAERASLVAEPPPGIRVRPLADNDMDSVTAFDAPAFAGDRSALLRHLLDRQPGRAFGAWRDGRLCGYVLARDGRKWTQIGPVIAETPDIAMALLAAASRAADTTPLLIDAMDYQTGVVEWLKAGGFVFQRPYIRMLYGTDRPVDLTERVFAPAGPELG